MAILPLELSEVSLHANGRALLDAISLRIEAGPKTIILGANGAGKSLLLRVCHGLLSPHRGCVQWQGPDAGEQRKRQAMVFQDPVMLRRSVYANVAYGLVIHRVPRSERGQRIAEVLECTGLADFAMRAAPTLSGGEQQRLALARVWALQPEVLFLDEPTASLDPGATAAVEAIVEDMHAQGCKLVMTTHDMGQARRLADEVIFLHQGRVDEHVAAEDFFASPQSETANAFLEGKLLW
jgi:tungstate transport system ATP-binding protein